MKFNIDDPEVKNLIFMYQSGDVSVFNTIISRISLYVYNFPVVMYNASRDEASEFYLYFMERLESCLDGFKDLGYKFSTYLTSVLINHYKNFIVQSRKRYKILLESDISESVNIFNLVSENGSENYAYDEIEEKVHKFFDTLDEFSKLFIKTFIFELTPDDLVLISKYANKSITTVLKEYNEILEKVSFKYQKRKKLVEKLHLSNNKKRILEKLNSMSVLCSYSDVGKLLNMTISNVGVMLKRIRERFSEYISK